MNGTIKEMMQGAMLLLAVHLVLWGTFAGLASLGFMAMAHNDGFSAGYNACVMAGQ